MMKRDKRFFTIQVLTLAQAVKNLYRKKPKLPLDQRLRMAFITTLIAPSTIVPEDIETIEKEMKRLVKENADYKRREVSRVEAIELFEKKR